MPSSALVAAATLIRQAIPTETNFSEFENGADIGQHKVPLDARQLQGD
jgi:hypothetical protein